MCFAALINHMWHVVANSRTLQHWCFVHIMHINIHAGEVHAVI